MHPLSGGLKGGGWWRHYRRFHRLEKEIFLTGRAINMSSVRAPISGGSPGPKPEHLSGIFTTEDLLEELVGEIEDEDDLGGPQRIQRLKDGGFLVDGFLPLNDLANLLGAGFIGGKPYETLSGLIFFELGIFPWKENRCSGVIDF
jgi:hypothetical protein